jgi:4'-phosphopantetheinyl transferase EntD
MMTSDPELSEALRTLAPSGIMVGHRLITPGDEHALLPEETGAFRSSTVQVKRASGAARIVARALLGRLGYKGTPLPKSAAGPPIWPSGILGSLAHDSRVAVAAVGCSKHLSGIGIDIEPAEALPTELLEFVTTARERVTVSADPFRGRLIFVAKEAVYKAVFPLDHCFLDHHDLEINISDQKATLRNGRVVNIRFCVSTHLVALALL